MPMHAWERPSLPAHKHGDLAAPAPLASAPQAGQGLPKTAATAPQGLLSRQGGATHSIFLRHGLSPEIGYHARVKTINDQRPKAHWTISMLSEATGVPTSTLRTWENRYGFPKPQRSPTGQRRYDEQQVDLINQLVVRLNSGERIGEAVRQVSLRLHATGGTADAPATRERLSYWEYLVDQMLSAVARFDEAALNALLSEALSLFSVQEVTYQLLCPTLFRLGERWNTQCAGIAEEHFFSAFLRGRIGAIAHHQSLQIGSGPQLLCCCLPGETHDLGLLIFCLEANIQRIRTIFLGADVPLEQIETVVADDRIGVEAVLLSATIKPSRKLLSKDLPALAQDLSVPVFIGGRASLKYQDEFESAGLQVVGNEMPAGANLIAQALAQSPFVRRRDASR